MTDKHTPGPWRVGYSDGGGGLDDGPPFTIQSVPRDAMVVDATKGEVEMRSYEYGVLEVADARLIAAACNSYDMHCGERAVECAEGDLLGEALELCKVIRQDCPLDVLAYRQGANGETLKDMLDAVLAKARPGTHGETE